jgi:hypothetical protein
MFLRKAKKDHVENVGCDILQPRFLGIMAETGGFASLTHARFATYSPAISKDKNLGSNPLRPEVLRPYFTVGLPESQIYCNPQIANSQGANLKYCKLSSQMKRQ